MTNRKKTGTKRRTNRKLVSGFGYHRRSVMLITMIMALLVCVLTFHAVTLQAKNKEYKQQETELKAQISEQKDRAKEVKEYEAYVQTDEYIKEIAEEKLGLVDPNEIIFKAAE